MIFQKVQFHEGADHEAKKLFENEIGSVDKGIEAERIKQREFPKNLRDYSEYEKLKLSKEALELNKLNIVGQQIFNGGQLIMLYCGRFIKYAQIKDQDLILFKVSDSTMSRIRYTNMKIQLAKSVEILRIWECCCLDQIQIIAKDHEADVLLVISWNIKSNMEESMLQLKCNALKPENYVVRGMNLKYNYFVSDSQIWDLEYNIPLQKSNNVDMTGLGISKGLVNQRKIFKNGTRSLGIDKACNLNFHNSRVDLLFWKGIVNAGNDVATISKNTNLEQFTEIFEDTSLIHFYSRNPDVIEMLYQKWYLAKDNNKLNSRSENVPLVLLHPDNSGRTALELAIQLRRPKSLELMVGLLEPFNDYCLSKMMLPVFPYMLQQQTTMIYNFMQSNTYQPVMMQEPMLIDWPEDKVEHIFASNTSVITANMLQKELFKPGKASQYKDKLKERINSQVLNKIKDSKVGSWIQNVEEIEPSQGGEVIKFNRNTLRSQTLNIDGSLDESNKKRIKIEAIDFDWVFKGDNAENFIKLLVSLDDGKLLIQDSVRIFIALMWKHYQRAIVLKVFIPYIAYMMIFVLLCGNTVGDYLAYMEEQTKLPAGEQHADKSLYLTIILQMGIALILWIKFFIVEFKQIIDDPNEYIKDYWNWIDMISQILNLTFLIMFFMDVSSWNENLHGDSMRSVGAVACFLLWIKVFYWMRLFAPTAHFITLIFQTIADVKIFTLMLVIILFAFANFFYIIDQNAVLAISRGEIEAPYVDTFFGNTYMDSVLSMYLLGMGEFGLDAYKEGPNSKMALTFFILGTFLVLVVFMNMLIAIMGDTFGNVQAKSEENSLREQVAMINDFLTLLSIKDVFKGKRYIIRLKEDVIQGEVAADLVAEIDVVKQEMKKQVNGM